MLHRSDIDGLRAVAILPVILYHAGAFWLPGGFLGVDVFFVISGFLITSIIVDEMRANRFSLFAFYWRRARRILPALVTVLGTTFLLSLLILTPAEMKDLGKMIVATSIFSSNIALWGQSGYFDAVAEHKPLLMTWSLGIEEQFYALWPLVLLCFVRARISPVNWTVGIAVASFGLATWAVAAHPSAAFYLLPTRAWELLVGASLALVSRDHARRSTTSSLAQNIASILGAGLILAAVLLLDRRSGIPGWPALMPCAGAAMLIWAGEKALVNRVLLSARPLVLVGLISYSLYLWHWPLLTLARLSASPDGLSTTVVGFVLLIAFGLSTLTWLFIETRFRRSRSAHLNGSLIRYASVILTAGILGTATVMAGGFPLRVRQQFTVEPSLVFSSIGSQPDCNSPWPAGCQAAAVRRSSVAVWGDSHADAISSGVGIFADPANSGVLLRTHNACPPLLGTNVIFDGQPFAFCRTFNEGVIAELASDPAIDVVMLVARWAWYTETTDFAFDRHYVNLTDDIDGAPSEQNSKRVFETALARTVSALTAAGKNVVLVGQVPELGFDLPSCLTRRELPPLFFDWPQCGVPIGLMARRLQFTNTVISSYSHSSSAVQILLASDVLCPGAECNATLDGHLLYSDDNHVSRAGATLLAEKISGLLAAHRRARGFVKLAPS